MAKPKMPHPWINLIFQREITVTCCSLDGLKSRRPVRAIPNCSLLSPGRRCCRLLLGLSFRECESGLLVNDFPSLDSAVHPSDGELHHFEREGPCRSNLPRLYIHSPRHRDSDMGSQPSGKSSQTSPTTGLRQCRRPPAKFWLTQAFGRAGLCGTSRGLLWSIGVGVILLGMRDSDRIMQTASRLGRSTSAGRISLHEGTGDSRPHPISSPPHRP